MRNKFIYISLGILFLASLIYWFIARPITIRKRCIEDLKTKSFQSVAEANISYSACLIRNGMRPESLD